MPPILCALQRSATTALRALAPTASAQEADRGGCAMAMLAMTRSLSDEEEPVVSVQRSDEREKPARRMVGCGWDDQYEQDGFWIEGG